MRHCLAVLGLFLLVFTAAWSDGNAVTVAITSDTASLGVGRTLEVQAVAKNPDGSPASGILLLPFVNGKRWGSHEYADAAGQARFMLPLPRPGAATIQVVASADRRREANDAWIWSTEPHLARTICLQHTFDLQAAASAAILWLAVDDRAVVYLNGTKVVDQAGWHADGPTALDPALLKVGANVVSVEATNGGGPAGLMARLVMKTGSGPRVLSTSGEWRTWTEKPQGWPGVATGGQPAVVQGDAWTGHVTPKAWPGLDSRALLFTGKALPSGMPVSNALTVEVAKRPLFVPAPYPGHETIVQWEPWFTPRNNQYSITEAVPIMGFYGSDDPNVHRQHLIWFIESGITGILADWSNHIWQAKSWEEISQGSHELIATTTLMMDELAAMRDEGYTVPKMTVLGGVSYALPEGVNAVNGELRCIWDTYIANPRYKGLWLEAEGKPLVTILDLPAVYLNKGLALDDRFSIRFVGVTGDLNKNAERGMWSWMDYARPVASLRNGKPEAMTVSVGCFGPGGWLGAMSRGRRNGATLLEDWRVAMEVRPAFLEIHQFNEFAGQSEGNPASPEAGYVDTYSPELSDDFEPTSLTASAYRSEGGWGFHTFNLTRALLDLYRQPVPETTVLVIAEPAPAKPGHSLIPVVGENSLVVKWVTAGKAANAFTVQLDGKSVAEHVSGDRATVDLGACTDGEHTVKVIGEGTQARYELLYEREALPLTEPVPAAAEVRFKLARPNKP